MSTAAAEQFGGLAHGTLLPIAIHSLTPNEVLYFDLYVQHNVSRLPVLYHNQCTAFTQTNLEHLTARGVETLYIRTADRGAYQNYLRKEVVENERIAPSQRYEVLREATRAVFGAVIRSGDIGDTVEFMIELGDQVAEIICHSDLVLHDLFSLMEYDYYTYTHAMSVCAYSVALAKQMELCSAVELPDLAVGGLLHDIGKRQIDSRVLNKPGELTTKERIVLQQHPKIGFELLCRREDLSWGQLMMVYQHHERLGGQGYPTGVTREDIHPWARICSIVDVFHAMTTARPYHKANSFGVVLDYLRRQAGVAFDADMVDCWIEIVR